MKNLKWQRKSSGVFRDNAISWTLGPTWEKNPADLGGNRKRLSTGKEWQRSTLKLDNPIVSPTTENRSKSDQLTWKKKNWGTELAIHTLAMTTSDHAFSNSSNNFFGGWQVWIAACPSSSQSSPICLENLKEPRDQQERPKERKKKKATRRETPNDQQWYVWTDRYRKWEEEDERE